MRNLILGLARPLRLLGRDDRGALGVLVAMMVGAGVLTGMGALVLDTGQLYQERAELQNVADAGALAVAKSCQSGTCASTSVPTLDVTGNASKLTGNTAATAVCGSVSPLTACTASTGPLDCPAAVAGTNYVDVHTSTQLSGGATLLPPVFAKTLLGKGSYQGSTVQACAQATWIAGMPSNPLVTAFTISACEWDLATTAGTVYGPAPPAAALSARDQKIKLRTLGSTGTGCTHYASPADAVNLFGWVSETGGCTLQIPGTTYSVLNSNSSPNCNTPLFDDAQNKSLIYVPVYTKVTGIGAAAVYNLLAIYGFVVTGYNIPGSTFNTYTDTLNSLNNCTGTTYCIDGYFVQPNVPAKLTG